MELNLAGAVPLVGPSLRRLVLGGPDAGQAVAAEGVATVTPLRPGPLDELSRQRVFVALYDLDALREAIKKDGTLEGLDIEAADRDAALEDDLALLRLGIRWLNATLFG